MADDTNNDAATVRARLEALRRRWPPGLVELHAEMTAMEVLRRVSELVDRTGESLELRALEERAMEWGPGGAKEMDRWFFEARIEEKAAARNLLWEAASWLEPDDVLMLVALAALRTGRSDRQARDLFYGLVGDPPKESPAGGLRD